MSGTIDLNPNHFATVERILAEHVPGCEVRAYGSRATWTAKDYSDLDLAVVGKGPLDWKSLGRLKESFEESNLPMRVDVLDWHSISESFREVIKRQYVVMQEGKKLGRVATGGWAVTAYGTFRQDFQRDLLSNLCSSESGIQTGPSIGSQLHKSDYVPVGTPIITVEHLGENRIIDKDVPCVSDYDKNRLSRYTLRQGDIVFSRVGSVDRRSLVREAEEGWLFSGRCLRVRPDVNKIDPAYLSYFFGLPAFKEYIRSIAVGATMPSLNTQILSDVSILFPPLPEQRAIAHVLGTLDDKIELNRRMNETLEEMARELFKSWFVDFEPVRAKMEGRWRRGETLPGLPAEHYDLFPDRLVPSELGEIPEGWEVRALGDCFNLTMGQSPPGKTYNANGEGLPFFQGNADFGFRYPERRKYCTAPTRIARPGDTLVSVRAPVGAINMAWEECCIGRGVSALRHPSGSRSFTYYAVRALQHKLTEYEHTGTVFGAINKRQFEKLMVIEAPKGFIDHFESYSQKWDERIRSNTKESFDLAAQRDALLPNLVSGVLRVRSQCINRQGST